MAASLTTSPDEQNVFHALSEFHHDEIMDNDIMQPILPMDQMMVSDCKMKMNEQQKQHHNICEWLFTDQAILKKTDASSSQLLLPCPHSLLPFNISSLFPPTYLLEEKKDNQSKLLLMNVASSLLNHTASRKEDLTLAPITSGKILRQENPRYRDDTLKQARAAIGEWVRIGKKLEAQVLHLIQHGNKTSADLKTLLPATYFAKDFPTSGRMLTLYMELLILSLSGGATLEFSKDKPNGDFHGIRAVHVPKESIAMLDAMPLPSLKSLQGQSKSKASLYKIWKEATFYQTVTVDGGLHLVHVPYVPKSKVTESP